MPTTSKITKAYLLADATKPLAVTCQTIALPAEAPDKIASVVVAEIEGEVQVVEPGATAIEQAADGVLTLPVGEAVLHGELKLEAKGTRENIGYWIKPADWVEWSINITKPGKFTVTAEIAAEKSGSFEIIIGDQKLKAQAPKTGDYGKFQKVKLGEIEIASVGKQTLAIKPVKQGWQPFNLTALTLTPVK